MNTLKRFISRRGKPEIIYSDNGTNFVGAARELNELYSFFQQEQINDRISNFLLESRIEWKFIIPNAPHHGGIWESAVKSAKLHLHRVTRNASFTYEEMCALLIEIECILNSRPITPLSGTLIRPVTKLCILPIETSNPNKNA